MIHLFSHPYQRSGGYLNQNPFLECKNFGADKMILAIHLLLTNP